MYEPILSGSKLRRYTINGFKGINETESCGDNEFRYTENIVGAFPAAMVRPHVKSLDTVAADVEKLVAIEQDNLFTGIAGDENGRRFYYRNKPVFLEGVRQYELVAESVCRMNGKIMIFPDKVYFDESTPENGLCDMTRSESITNAVFHSETDSEGVITNYISGGSFSEFRRGESVVISGCSDSANNVVPAGRDSVSGDIVSAIVEKISGGRMYLLCYTSDGADAAFQNVTSNCTIGADIPDMNRVCCQNNRLWGTATDGSTIYASKLGDPFDFNTFAGISTDSWWGRVATDGIFTGIYPYQNHIYAFKEGYIHEIYGDKPSNFKMPYSVKCGTVDGDSISELDGVMYFASGDGVYAYNGGIPQKISQKLDIHPENARSAVSDGKLCMVLDEVMYLYDTERGDWYRIGDAKVTDIVSSADGMYFAEDGVLKKWNCGSEQVKWCIQTKEFFRTEAQKNGCVNVWLKLSLADNACAAVYTSMNGGEFRRWGVVRGDARACRVPVRFRQCDTFAIRIEGVGDAKLYGIEFENYSGGYSIPTV